MPSELAGGVSDSGMLNGGWRRRRQPCCLWWMRFVWVLCISAVVGCRNVWMPRLSIPAAILVGTINAVGGSLLRDVQAGKVPLLFKPGRLLLCLDRVRRCCLFCDGVAANGSGEGCLLGNWINVSLAPPDDPF